MIYTEYQLQLKFKYTNTFLTLFNYATNIQLRGLSVLNGKTEIISTQRLHRSECLGLVPMVG
jgi:hypothetical protein